MQTWILGFYLREFFPQSLFDSGLALDINYLSLEIALSIVSNHCLPSLFLGGKEQLVMWLNLLLSSSKSKTQGINHEEWNHSMVDYLEWLFHLHLFTLVFETGKGSDVNYMCVSIWWSEAWEWILRHCFRLERLGNVATNTTTILMVNQNSIIFSQANLLLVQASLQGFFTRGPRIPGHFYLMVLLFQYRVPGFV